MSVLHQAGRLPGTPLIYRESWGARFNNFDSAYMHRTFVGAGNNKIFTVAAWLKRARQNGAGVQSIVTARNGGGTEDDGVRVNNDQVQVYGRNGLDWGLVSTALLRDSAAPGHLVIGVDTTQALDTNRVKGWWSNLPLTWTGSYPAQNYVFPYFNAATEHRIGDSVTASSFFDGYLLSILRIDGLQLSPSDLARYLRSVWWPKRYTGVFGANGFYLDFDPARYGEAVTLANVCKDRSGNGHHFTGVNLDATSTDHNLDHVKESATPKGDQGNYATWAFRVPPGPGKNAAGATNGNLDQSFDNNEDSYPIPATIGVTSGKWFWKVKPVSSSNPNNYIVGVCEQSKIGALISGGQLAAIQASGIKYKWDGSTEADAGVAFATNDDLIFALDMDAGKLWCQKNGAWMNGGDPVAGTNPLITGITGTVFPCVISGSSTATFSYRASFGQQPISGPSGYKLLHTGNLPRPAIANPAEAFNAAINTGANIEAAIAALRSGWGAWIEEFKDRTNAQDWKVRFSDDVGNMLSWNRGDIGKAAYSAPTAGDNYVGYVTRVGAAYGVTTAEVVHVNGVATNWAHSLGSARKVATVKRVDAAGDFFYSHPDLSAGRLLKANSANGDAADASISVDGTNVTLAAALPSGTYRIIAKSEITGLRKFGKYSPNGSTNGPLLYAAVRPKRLTTKRVDSAGNWYRHDGARNPTNPVTALLTVEQANVEGTSTYLDRLASGAKIINTDSSQNPASGTIIWEIEAEADFSRARAV